MTWNVSFLYVNQINHSNEVFFYLSDIQGNGIKTFQAGAKPFTRLRRAVIQIKKKLMTHFSFNFYTAYVPLSLSFTAKIYPTFRIFYSKPSVPLFLAIQINYLPSAATLLSTATLIN